MLRTECRSCQASDQLMETKEGLARLHSIREKYLPACLATIHNPAHLGTRMSKNDRLEPPTLADNWGDMRFVHRVLYPIYILPALLVFTTTALLMYLPWTLTPRPKHRIEQSAAYRPWVDEAVYQPSFWRPSLMLPAIRKRKSRGHVTPARPRAAHYDPLQPNLWKTRALFMPFGRSGFDIVIDGSTRLDISAQRHSVWRGFWIRVWDAYVLLRDTQNASAHQGAQVAGVLCGLFLFAMQVAMIGFELSSGRVGVIRSIANASFVGI